VRKLKMLILLVSSKFDTQTKKEIKWCCLSFLKMILKRYLMNS